MKAMLNIYTTELKVYRRVLYVSSIIIMGLYLFILARIEDHIGAVLNLYSISLSLALIILTAFLTYHSINREWADNTGLLTFTVPLSKWKTALSKYLGVITIWLLLSILSLFSLWILLIQKDIGIGLEVMPNIIEKSSYLNSIHVFREYLRSYIVLVIPLVLGLSGLILLSTIIFRTVNKGKFFLGLMTTMVPIYAITCLTLYMDARYVGPMPYKTHITFLAENDLLSTALSTYTIASIPFSLSWVSGIGSIILGLWIFHKYTQY